MITLEKRLRDLAERWWGPSEPEETYRDLIEDFRTAVQLGIEAHREQCASNGCMWCKEQRKREGR